MYVCKCILCTKKSFLFCILHQMSSLGLDQRLALLSPDLTLNPLQWNRISGSELGAEKKCILPRTRGWEINPIWPRSDLDKMVISELVARSECEWHFSIFSPRLWIKGKPRASVERTHTNCPCLGLTLSICFAPGQKVSGPVYMSAVPGIDPRAGDKR